MEIITISNQKGGVGKTTTAHTLAIGLFKKKYKVLLIDSDPQCNLTYSLNAMNREKTLYNVYNGENIKQCITPTTQGVHLLSGDIKLLNADKQYTDIGKEYILKKAIDEVKQFYDYIIIDTPPTLRNIDNKCFNL